MSLFEESIPLLTKPRKTPLPKFQLFILLWVQLAEPITSQVIYPFVNQVRRMAVKPLTQLTSL